MTTTDLVAGYRPSPSGRDEMLDADGQLRPTWNGLASVLDELGGDELARRRLEADRLLDEDGVTYNIHGHPEGRGRRWELDPVPFVLASDEWADIERGVIQRTELLNLVLTDLYGPRDLVRRDLLPPEVVFGHPGFLRSCDGVRLPGTQQLFTTAVDLARTPDGIVVLADRTQAPSGAGYALENRVVTSRVLPSLYRDAQVHRLAPFFRTLRSGLQAVAPATGGDPRVVVLTPGSLAETSFEHAFLASYLGYPLVEGSDLVVRDGRVWMRSLGRLESVDVILRRVDPWFCDPLELLPSSQLGVPGLVEACRLGTVSVVNTLGSAVLENPALLSFLPRVATRLLGQPLRLESVTTWWCGEDTARNHVLARLDRLVLKPVARTTGPTTIYGWMLSADELDELRRRIEANPCAWVGQEAVDIGSAPTLVDRNLEARRCVLRAFLVARGESYAAMPGGLTRVASGPEGLVVSNQAGAVSKDTWVLASEPETLTGFWLQSGPAVDAVAPEGSMSSRAAENLFWLGRYAERAEGVTRLVRVTYDRRNDFGRGSNNPAGTECLDALLVALTRVSTTYPGFVGDGAAARVEDPATELTSLVLDSGRSGTLSHSVRAMLDAAYAVRDQLSNDTWLVVAELERSLLGPVGPRTVGRSTLGRVLTSLLALSGLAAESMVRDPGWRFMDAGRRIERSLQLSALLRATITVERDVATDSLLLESVLTAAESIITYRRRYRSHAQVETLLDLLLLDADNPRSLANQVGLLAADLAALPSPTARLSDASRHVLEASTALQLAETDRLAAVDDTGTRSELVGLLDRFSASLAAAADALAATHFAPRLPQHELLVPAAGV